MQRNRVPASGFITLQGNRLFGSVRNMKQRILCVIAHPGDEAFGPSGTLALLAKKYEVHLVCLTDGASDKRFHPLGAKVKAVRAKELQRSAGILGIKKVHFLDYGDGSLCDNLYHEVADGLQKLVNQLHPSLLVTNELRGMSGHLDHVAAGLITSFVYRNSEFIDGVLYTVAPRTASDAMQDYFVYFPPGFNRDEVDLIVDIRSVFAKKLAAARSHVSQGKDVERVTKRWRQIPREEWFLVNERRKILDIPQSCLNRE